MSCGSCHQQDNAFADFFSEKTSLGVNNTRGRRNAMPLFNLAWQEFFFWDGRARSLEEQSLHPIEDPNELGTDLPTVIGRLEKDTAYPAMFAAAFGSEKINKDRIAKAMAQFERTIISANSEYDQVKRLQGANTLFTEDPMTLGSKNRGFEMFEREEGDCFHCHQLGNHQFGASVGFSEDIQFQNNGLDTQSDLDKASADRGREEETRLDSDRGKFKVPTVRNMIFTFPFMHDGSIPHIDSLVEFYNSGGHASATIDTSNLQFVGVGHNWSEQQKADLVEFLFTLTDDSFLTDSAYANPFEK